MVGTVAPLHVSCGSCVWRVRSLIPWAAVRTPFFINFCCPTLPYVVTLQRKSMYARPVADSASCAADVRPRVV